MSHYEDDEEDELQLILEGRNVQHYEEFRQYRVERTEDNSSEHSAQDYDHYVSDEDIDDKQTTSTANKRQRSDDNFSQRMSQNKRKLNSLATHSQDISNEEHNPMTTNGVTNETTDENEAKIKAKVRRIIRKPQPKLNEDRLMTNEGIAVLPEIFKDFKFGPKGSELKDLNAIMFRLSHWSHRLFPSVTFDDFIEKCEQLGNKRRVKTFLAKIRYNLPLNLSPEDNILDVQNSDEDFEPIENDFDHIVANNYVNKDNYNQKMTTKESVPQELNEVENENQLTEKSGSERQTTHQNSQTIETNSKEQVSEEDKQMDDPNEEELTEEQLINEINCDNSDNSSLIE